jgi:hypothetical protein
MVSSNTVLEERRNRAIALLLDRAIEIGLERRAKAAEERQSTDTDLDLQVSSVSVLTEDDCAPTA